MSVTSQLCSHLVNTLWSVCISILWILSSLTSSSFIFLHARNLAHGLQKSVFQFNNICLSIFTNTTDWEGSFHFMNTNIVFKIANIAPSGSADGQAGQERWFTVVDLLMSSPMLRKAWAHAVVPAAGLSCAQAEWEHLKAPHEGQLHVGRVTQGMGRGLTSVAGTVMFIEHLDTSGWPPPSRAHFLSELTCLIALNHWPWSCWG